MKKQSKISSKFDGFLQTFVHCLGLCHIMTPASTGSNYGGDVHSKSMRGCPWRGLQLTARHFVPGQWVWGTHVEIGRSKMGSELVEKKLNICSKTRNPVIFSDDDWMSPPQHCI